MLNETSGRRTRIQNAVRETDGRVCGAVQVAKIEQEAEANATKLRCGATCCSFIMISPVCQCSHCLLVAIQLAESTVLRPGLQRKPSKRSFAQLRGRRMRSQQLPKTGPMRSSQSDLRCGDRAGINP